MSGMYLCIRPSTAFKHWRFPERDLRLVRDMMHTKAPNSNAVEGLIHKYNVIVLNTIRKFDSSIKLLSLLSQKDKKREKCTRADR